MNPSFVRHTFELLTFAFGLLMIWHALVATKNIKLSDTGEDRLHPSDEPNSRRWLSTLLWGFAFGYVIECLLIQKSGYSYGKVWVMLPNPFVGEDPAHLKDVPLWVGIGWGVLVYATTWTAQRLKQRWYARAVLAGLLAVNIDFSLDPVARIFELWTWVPEYPSYYGVPFDNFVCWVVITTTYTLLVRMLFRTEWLARLWGSAFWVPGLSMGAALGIVYQIDELLQAAYKKLHGDALIFILVFAVACAIVGRHARRPPFDRRASWAIMALPLAYHGLSWVFLILSGKYLEPGHTTLVVAIPLGLAVGFLAFGWASLDRLFPHTQPDT